MLLEGNLMGVQHLGLPVTDVAKAKSFYTSKLGFEVKEEPVVRTDEGNVLLLFLERRGLVLEFWRPVGAALDEVAARGHGHIDHFAMDVTDVRRAMADAQANGIALDPGTADGPAGIPQAWSKGVEYVFMLGPHGEKFEFNERLDLARSRRVENLGGWSHLGIPVTDIQSSVRFYEAFGFTVKMEATIPVGEEDIKIAIVENGGLSLEFYRLIAADLPEIRSRKDGRIDHFAMGVRDVDRAYAELKEAGLKPIEDAPVDLPIGPKGVRFFNVRGPDGEKMELIQRL